jgi:GDPmannose 4,6-dehydratase/GDP-4-dehydro-6-deoxy-D-mannose reductase
MSKKTLITGINGSGASYLAEYLSTFPDVEIQGITRWHTDRSRTNGGYTNLKDAKSKVKLFECDLTDLSSVIRTLELTTPDIIFHMASHANVRLCFENPIAIFNNNVNGTLNLLEGLRILKMKPIVHFCGTSEVYGQVKPEDIPIKETHPIDPINVYAISKLAQEKLCRSYYLSYGIPVVLTRSFSYINPRRPDIFSSTFARQIVEIEKGRRTKLLHGNLDSYRTVIDIRDVVEAYWLSVQHCEYGVPYNVGGTTSITVGEFLEELKKHSKVNIPSEVDPSLLRPVDVTLQIPDISKFCNKTGWSVKRTLSDSIEFLLDYYRNIT